MRLPPIQRVESRRDSGGHTQITVVFRGPAELPCTPRLLFAHRDEPADVWALPLAPSTTAADTRVHFSVPPELRAALRHPLLLSVGGTSWQIPAPQPASERRETVSAERAPGATVLVVDDDPLIRTLVGEALRGAGHEIVEAADGRQALELADRLVPDLVVSDVMMPDLDGFGLVEHLRAQPGTAGVPLIFLTSLGSKDDVVRGLGLGADDYLPKPFSLDELLARVDAKLSRRPVPVERLGADPRTGLTGFAAFRDELERELARHARGGAGGCLAQVRIEEADAVRERFGPVGEAELVGHVARAFADSPIPGELVSRTEGGRFVALLPDTGPADAAARLERLAGAVAGALPVGGDRIRISAAAGYATLDPALGPDEHLDRAQIALEHAASHLDLRPQRYDPSMGTVPEERAPGRLRRLGDRLRLPFQLAVTQLAAVIVPFFVYLGLYEAGIDIGPTMYMIVVVALLITAASIWMEGLKALRPVEPPDEPGAPEPAASAIIAAYLPNEAATVMETIEAFLRMDYGGPLQIILAYNTPHDMPVEAELRELAERDPRFVPYRVMHSTSKAQNVNSALAQVTGEFVGVFDADHQPDPTAYSRAWRWLSNGYDVVQGHCLVRNGDASWVARTVAVEFEMIYAVSHPGRARLHRFGIFGGSNGYWRTDLLNQIRMRGSMLTEDIDSSLRVVEGGGRIASDPGLISRELGPATMTALWNQRMRWAQGWFQVSMKHLWRALRSPKLSVRQKIGMFWLLGWREIYPWISLQMFPLILFLGYRAGGVQHLDFFVPFFVLTTLFTVSTGPWQTLFAHRLAAPEIRAHGRWFWWYLLISSFFYTEYKNAIGRVAQMKELMGERAWKVTPRETSGAGSSASGPARGDRFADAGDELLEPVDASGP